MNRALVALALMATAGGWLSDCTIWHGEQTCRERYTKTHVSSVPSTVHEKGRSCATAWADVRRDCGGQA